eukprot:g377.t1
MSRGNVRRRSSVTQPIGGRSSPTARAWASSLRVDLPNNDVYLREEEDGYEYGYENEDEDEDEEEYDSQGEGATLELDNGVINSQRLNSKEDFEQEYKRLQHSYRDETASSRRKREEKASRNGGHGGGRAYTSTSNSSSPSAAERRKRLLALRRGIRSRTGALDPEGAVIVSEVLSRYDETQLALEQNSEQIAKLLRRGGGGGGGGGAGAGAGGGSDERSSLGSSLQDQTPLLLDELGSNSAGLTNEGDVKSEEISRGRKKARAKSRQRLAMETKSDSRNTSRRRHVERAWQGAREPQRQVHSQKTLRSSKSGRVRKYSMKSQTPRQLVLMNEKLTRELRQARKEIAEMESRHRGDLKLLSSTNAELSSRIEEAAVSETKARTELELAREDLQQQAKRFAELVDMCRAEEKAKEGASSELASLQKKLRESERRQTHLMSRLHVEQRNRELTDGSHMKEEIKRLREENSRLSLEASRSRDLQSERDLAVRRLQESGATIARASVHSSQQEQPLRPQTVANGDGTSDLKRHLSEAVAFGNAQRERAEKLEAQLESMRTALRSSEEALREAKMSLAASKRETHTAKETATALELQSRGLANQVSALELIVAENNRSRRDILSFSTSVGSADGSGRGGKDMEEEEEEEEAGPLRFGNTTQNSF